jgi:hypothetical protein
VALEDALYLCNTGADDEDSWLGFQRRLANDLEADLHGLGVLPVESSESVVNLRHQCVVPAVEVFLDNLAAWESPRLRLWSDGGVFDLYCNLLEKRVKSDTETTHRSGTSRK